MSHGPHAESHADGHDASGPGRAIGITMAVLGVMLALCAAMVGTQRTLLIKTMVDQSDKLGLYQSEAMKFRTMQADYEILHALTPSKAEVRKFETALSAVHGRAGKADSEDTAELKETIDVATRELADILSPDREDEDRMRAIAKRYQRDMAEAREDAEAYEAAVEAHHEAAEHYEHAQLCVELGIVIASIALLLGNRIAWGFAILAGLAGAGMIGTTYVSTSRAMAQAEAHIALAAKSTAKLENEEAEPEPAASPPTPPGPE
jgi:hypothetical protein